MNIIDYIQQCQSEYFNEILQREKQANSAYREAEQKLIDSSKALDVKDASVSAYSDATYEISDIERELIYAQGYKDCLALLKFLQLV